MLLYYNRSFLRLVLAQHGSIFLRLDNVTYGFLLAAIAAFLQFLNEQESDFAPQLPHHYGMHALGTVVIFAVVFRTNLGWQRYWEANTQLHFMYSKWGDAYAQFFAFSQVSIDKAPKNDSGLAATKRVEEIIESVTNNFILLSAIAAHRLTNGDTSRMEQLCRHGDIKTKAARWQDRVVKREALQRGSGHEPPGLPEFEILGKNYREGRGEDDAGVADSSGSGSCNPHQSLSSHVRSSAFAHAGSGGFQRTWEHPWPIKHEMSKDEEVLLKKSTDRTAVVMYWLLRDLAKISKDLCIAPPIQTRMYQELSNGMLGFNQCVKLADVPFPFPYAQILTVLLTCYVWWIPVYVVAFTQSMIVGPIMSFAIFQGVWGLNETAKELENPFGIDINDVTLIDFHLRFVDVCEEISMAQKLMYPRKSRTMSNGSDAKVKS